MIWQIGPYSNKFGLREPLFGELFQDPLSSFAVRRITLWQNGWLVCLNLLDIRWWELACRTQLSWLITWIFLQTWVPFRTDIVITKTIGRLSEYIKISGLSEYHAENHLLRSLSQNHIHSFRHLSDCSIGPISYSKLASDSDPCNAGTYVGQSTTADDANDYPAFLQICHTEPVPTIPIESLI